MTSWQGATFHESLADLTAIKVGMCGACDVTGWRPGTWERPMAEEDLTEEGPSLSISPESVCYIVVKAREFDAKDEVSDDDVGSNPSDDKMIDVLEDHGDDPVAEELKAFIDSLNEDGQIELVALAWLGRGDGSLAEWSDLREEAARAHNKRTAEYLLGMPLLADHLEEALSMFDMSCEEFELGHL